MLIAFQRENRLRNVSDADFTVAAVEILAALRKLGEQVSSRTRLVWMTFVCSCP
jgi:hypothetical protein